MNDEYNNNNGKEYNDVGSEIQNLPAIEYYNPNAEVVDKTKQSGSVPENYNDVDNKLSPEMPTKKSVEEEQKERLDRATQNQTRNNADTGLNDSTQITSNGEVVDSSSAAEAESAAGVSSAASSTSSVVSTASLTSGVTVLSACAVVAATVGAGIMHEPPKVDYSSYISGADYIDYEIAVSNMADDLEYYLAVELDNKVITEIPVEREGITKRLITGLIPDLRYDIKLVTGTGFGRSEFHTDNCYTDTKPDPEAVFKFEPKIDYENGIFDLEYNVYFSDYYGTGANTYLELYMGDNLYFVDDKLTKDSFFKGALTRLPDNVKIGAKLYSTVTHYGISELKLIGDYGYLTSYPDDFVSLDNKYKSEYTFDKSSFESSFNKSNGTNTLNINTGFKQSIDDREKYRIDIVDKFNPETVIDSKTSNEPNISFDIPAYYTSVIARFVPIKENTSNNNIKQKLADNTEFEITEVEYTFDPLFTEQEMYYFTEGYSVSSYAREDIFNADDILKAKITHYSNGVAQEPIIKEFRGIEFSAESMEIDPNLVLADVDKIKVEIYYNDILISINDFDNFNETATLGSLSIDDDGNVTIPYEISIGDNLVFDSAMASLNGVGQEIELTENKSELFIPTLLSNKINGGFEVTYKTQNGATLRKYINVDEIELNANIVVSSYITYISSELKCNLKVDTYVDDKKVNMDHNVSVYKDNFGEYIYEDVTAYEGIYFDIEGITEYDQDAGKYNYYVKYKVDGFDTDYVTLNIASNVMNMYGNTNSDLYKYSTNLKEYDSDEKTSIYYIKTKNEDGTVNYYFYSGFKEELDAQAEYKHKQRIQYSYVKDGKTCYKYGDFFTDNYYAIENVEDLNYDFKYMVFYDYDGLSYASTISDGLLYEAKEAIYDQTDTIRNEEDGKTRINFRIDLASLNGSSLAIDYNGVVHEIPIPESGTAEGEDNKGMTYYNSIYDDLLLVELEFTDKMDFSEKVPFIIFNYCPAVVKHIGKEKIINYSSLIEDVNLDICKYTGSFDVSAIDFTNEDCFKTYYDDYSGNRITLDLLDYKYTDDRDGYKLKAYYNDELVGEGQYTPGGDLNCYIAPLYDKVKLYVVEIKDMGDDSIEYKNYYIGDWQFEDRHILEGNDSIDITNTDGIQRINYTATANDASQVDGYTFTIEVDQYENGEYQNTAEVLKDATTDLSFEYDFEQNIDNFDIRIYRVGQYGGKVLVYRRSFDVPKLALNDYEYVDGENYISIPYNISLPTGATITSGTIEYGNIVENITDVSGSFNISELDSNNIYLHFAIEYELDGINYSYSNDISKELIMNIDFDYDVVNYGASSTDVKYDVSTGKAYRNYDSDEDIYYDDDNQAAPDDAIRIPLMQDFYVIEGKVVGKVGCFTVPFTSSNFELNITKSGEPIAGIEGYTDFSKDYYKLAEPTTYNGATLPEKLTLVFYHTITDYVYDSTGNRLYPDRSCELEFSITDLDSGYVRNKTVTYDPPVALNIPSRTDAFNGFSANIVKNGDKINLEVNTGFDAETYENYYYKLYVYDKLKITSNLAGNLVYESDYINLSELTIENLDNLPYEFAVDIYYKNNGQYCNYLDKSVVYTTNSVIKDTTYEYNQQNGSAIRTLELDTSMLNPNNMVVRFTSDGGNEAELDLNSTDTINFTTGTIKAETEGDSIIITISAAQYMETYGTIVINQGNDEIGYVDVTYTI